MSKAPTKTNFTAALEAARQIQSAEQELLSRKTELLAEIKPIEDRNLRLWRMPCTKAEIQQRVHAHIDSLAARFLGAAKWDEVFKAFAYPSSTRPTVGGALSLTSGWHKSEVPLNLQDISQSVRWDLGDILGADAGSQFDTVRSCFFFGDAIKAKIDAHFDRLMPTLRAAQGHEQQSPELTLVQRTEEIDRNDARIAILRGEVDEVERQLEELALARGLKPAMQQA